MGLLTASEIISAAGGELLLGALDAEFESISTDSRSITPGCLFVPLFGEKFDGHDFIAKALESGALGTLTSRTVNPDLFNRFPDRVIIKVNDTLEALGLMARGVRRKFRVPVAGLTGSTGKTTTKDMLTSILSRRFNVVATAKNFNNEIGVPLTLFKMRPETQAVVVEMGMRGPGQIQALSRISEPTLGLITNIGTAHYGLLGSVDAIADAKSELIESLPLGGVAVLNAENEPWTSKIAPRTKARVLTFGLEAGEVHSRDRKPDREACYSFTLVSPWGEAGIRLRQPGLFNVTNALAASAAAMVFGCTLDDVKAGLEAFEPTEMRMQVIHGPEMLILNDVYNANPASMIEAVRTLMELEGFKTRIAALGAMLELGDISKEQHRMVGKFAAGLGVDFIVVYHEEARGIKCGAIAAGMPEDRVLFSEDHAKAAEAVRSLTGPETAVLVKGSRGMKMEEITKLIINSGSE